MGRLPATFAQREIRYRQPWEFYGEISVVSAQQNKQFPDATYMNNTDKPFEIHRVIPRVLALDTNGVAVSVQPDQELLMALVRVMINDLGKSTPLMKSPTPLDSLVKGTSERTWEWAEPYYLVKGEQFQITTNADTFPTAAPFASVVSLQVRLTFEGFFLVVAPPSENR
jgi:hypothetical protein